MIKELLIVILLLHSSQRVSLDTNSSFLQIITNTYSTDDQAKKGELDYKIFTISCKGREFIGDKMICFSTKYKGFMQDPPIKFLGLASRLYLNFIEMDDVEIINIGMHTMRISMSLNITWEDHRLLVIPGSRFIYLSAKDQKKIWSPRIAIVTNIMSQKKEEEEFIVKNNTGSALASKIFILNTLVKCEMEFQNFPFDQHTCNLEVCRSF